MNLSDFDGKFYRVVRNGYFETLGFVWKKLPEQALGYATDVKYLRILCKNPTVSCVIVSEELAMHHQLLESGKGIAVCSEPEVAFILLHNFLMETVEEYGGGYNATKIGKDCRIHPMASIANKGVIIGDNVTVEEFVSIRQGCRLGSNVTIHTGAAIGIDHKDLCWDSDGRILKMQEAGQVFIADDVEIGCYASIGRGTFPYDTTVVGENTCIDGCVVIGHNCHIAGNCYISVSACICGSVNIEDNVRINPMATVKNSITIGKNAVISMGAVVVENVPEASRVSGNFAMEHSMFLADRLHRLREI